ncbi:fungal hydrophobin domain-containing protein [Penicillium longicatenatum]|uniref:fungal hydrophobin domain-containing protein n=1 Tax=Penicillium longicatenatum TaxID=1561947 RepID=UPI002546C4DF|nr:fungal hydrophobin domain-containing protein [Penicillium longicatenatum]KAJ5651504.1 fungal hydrophobin domain-containing protein [Penicillium longicatenatum]KAJ5670916.1 fungal hydrophobin domain-containing protein [Penicillium longicatenatum]
MKVSILLVAASAGAALAHPAALVARTSSTSSACPNKLYSVPSCCSPNLLKLGCSNPSSAKDGPELKKSCSDQKPLCCSTPSALAGGLCVNPAGIKEDH